METTRNEERGTSNESSTLPFLSHTTNQSPTFIPPLLLSTPFIILPNTHSQKKLLPLHVTPFIILPNTLSQKIFLHYNPKPLNIIYLEEVLSPCIYFLFLSSKMTKKTTRKTTAKLPQDWQYVFQHYPTYGWQNEEGYVWYPDPQEPSAA